MDRFASNVENPWHNFSQCQSEKSSFHTLLIQRQNFQSNRYHLILESFNHLKTTNLNISISILLTAWIEIQSLCFFIDLNYLAYPISCIPQVGNHCCMQYSGKKSRYADASKFLLLLYVFSRCFFSTTFTYFFGSLLPCHLRSFFSEKNKFWCFCWRGRGGINQFLVLLPLCLEMVLLWNEWMI